MKPIEFKEQNVVYAKDQPQYQPLPAHKNKEGMGEVISCWKLTFWERVKLLFTGKLWVSLCMFGKPLTPSFFTVNKYDVFNKPEKS